MRRTLHPSKVGSVLGRRCSSSDGHSVSPQVVSHITWLEGDVPAVMGTLCPPQGWGWLAG